MNSPFSFASVKPADQARVDELHRLIDDAEARVRELQTIGSERAAERQRMEFELGSGPDMPEPGPSSVLARLNAIRLDLARKPGSPKPTDAEAALNRRRRILEGGIAALSTRLPAAACRSTCA